MWCYCFHTCLIQGCWLWTVYTTHPLVRLERWKHPNQQFNSPSLHLAEPWSSSTEVDSWQHPGASQTSRESCLMKLTARSLCPTTTVHDLHEIMLSWCLLVCRSVGGHIVGMSNSITIQDYSLTLLPQTHPDQILEFPFNNLVSSY